MLIGIAGHGVVGGALDFSFRKLGYDVIVHDPKHGTKLADLLSTDMAFIATPTPAAPSGACDTSIVESVVDELCNSGYKGIIAIKSTIAPGTTSKLINRHSNDKICFVPEFLREHCAIADVVENQKILAIGTHSKEVYNLVKDVHGEYPQAYAHLTPTQAELLKYAHNCFNALRIVFANEMFEVCQHLGERYTPVKNALVKTAGVKDMYLDCNENMRGYAGSCLPKDVAAMRHLVEQAGIDVDIFGMMERRNARLKKTVPPGMRL